HIGGINNPQPRRLPLANRHHFVFRRAAAVEHPPVTNRLRRAHLRQQRPGAVIAHHAVSHAKQHVSHALSLPSDRWRSPDKYHAAVTATPCSTLAAPRFAAPVPGEK